MGVLFTQTWKEKGFEEFFHDRADQFSMVISMRVTDCSFAGNGVINRFLFWSAPFSWQTYASPRLVYCYLSRTRFQILNPLCVNCMKENSRKETKSCSTRRLFYSYFHCMEQTFVYRPTKIKYRRWSLATKLTSVTQIHDYILTRSTVANYRLQHSNSNLSSLK